jgi:hypothetical protein
MTSRTAILARFGGAERRPPFYLPDLTLWFDWHHSRGTLPDQWQDLSLPQIARAMGAAIWLPLRPWRVETPDIEIQTTEQVGERTIRTETPAGTITARWTLGPDGDWWQVEYPVKTADDLPAALASVKARTYVMDTSQLLQAIDWVGEGGILALELPRRPYSDLLHEFLGWSEGLLLLGEPLVQEMIEILEDRLQELVGQVADVPGDLVLSPDNLDGQFISPRVFAQHLAASYQSTTSQLHTRGKHLVVHIGGPIRHLLQPLADVAVDGLEGISGPPQSNATLAEARQVAGPDVTLWGGIAQDYLQATHAWDAFEAAVRQAVRETSQDGRMILGVADRVPVDAELDRLQSLPAMIQDMR